jgi:hypothetical protein
MKSKIKTKTNIKRLEKTSEKIDGVDEHDILNH